MMSDFAFVDAGTRGYGEFLVKGELAVVDAVLKDEYLRDGANPNITVNAEIEQYRSRVIFKRINTDGTLTPVLEFTGCLNPSKVVVADFNADGAPDVFLPCNGNDLTTQTDGEKSSLFLSTGFGQYTLRTLPFEGYWHGATAADINGDGYPDIAVTDHDVHRDNKVYFLINRGDGTFSIDKTRIQTGVITSQYYYFVTELVDVNADGHPDLIVGGNDVEYTIDGFTYRETPTQVLLNNGAGLFGEKTIQVPPVRNKGTVTDFNLVTGNGRRELFVTRNDDPGSPNGAWRGWAIQHVDLDTMKSVVVSDEALPPGNYGWFWLSFKIMVPKFQNGVWGVVPAGKIVDRFFAPPKRE